MLVTSNKPLCVPRCCSLQTVIMLKVSIMYEEIWCTHSCTLADICTCLNKHTKRWTTHNPQNANTQSALYQLPSLQAPGVITTGPVTHHEITAPIRLGTRQNLKCAAMREETQTNTAQENVILITTPVRSASWLVWVCLTALVNTEANEVQIGSRGTADVLQRNIN